MAGTYDDISLKYDVSNYPPERAELLKRGRSIQYTVAPGENLYAVAQKFYGYGEEWQLIYQANPHLWKNITGKQYIDNLFQNAAYLIFSGQKITIPGRWQSRPYPADQLTDELNIFMAGDKLVPPSEFTFTEYFDSCADDFTMVFPFDPSDPLQRDRFRAESLAPVEIFIKDQRVFTGFAEQHAMHMTPEEMSVTVGGRSRSYILQKTDIFAKRQFQNASLIYIAQQLCNPLGIRVAVYNGIDDKQDLPDAAFYGAIECESAQNAFEFLANLAKQKSVLVRNNNEGDITLFRYPKTPPAPVANFDLTTENMKILGIPSLDVKYDTNAEYGSYVIRGQIGDYGRYESTYRNPRLREVSIKIDTANESGQADVTKAATVAGTKSVRDFFDGSIEFPDWFVPPGSAESGKRWRAGHIVTVRAPGLQIYAPHRMIVKVAAFKWSANKRVCNLQLVPEESFNGKDLIAPPWCKAAEKGNV